MEKYAEGFVRQFLKKYCITITMSTSDMALNILTGGL